MNYIHKILIGRVFKYHNGYPLVILGVKRSPYWNHNGTKYPKEYRYYEILVGRIYLSKKNEYRLKDNNRIIQVSVMSWYSYYSYDITYLNRSPREHIRNCMKKQPNKINYHKGIQLSSDRLKINDNCDYYKEYQKYINS